MTKHPCEIIDINTIACQLVFLNSKTAKERFEKGYDMFLTIKSK